MSAERLIERGRRVIELEREALGELCRRLGPEFARAIHLLKNVRGRVLVSGLGKSGIIARKIAATLTSTGTPATYLHPAEALHGDLGIVGPTDVAILISKSGETDEIVSLLNHLRRFGVCVIGVTGGPRSTLGREAEVTLDVSVREEACPFDLAPTASTTAVLALGDALAVVLLEEKGFHRDDFARLHPGGTLGRRLLTRVADVMVTEDLPLLPPDATMREAVVVLAEKRGIVIVVDAARRLSGVMTAGDLTRLMERERDVLPVRVDQVMTRSPRTAERGELGTVAVYKMERHGIMALPVVDEGKTVVGVVHLHDLMRAGVA